MIESNIKVENSNISDSFINELVKINSQIFSREIIGNIEEYYDEDGALILSATKLENGNIVFKTQNNTYEYAIYS